MIYGLGLVGCAGCFFGACCTLHSWWALAFAAGAVVSFFVAVAADE